MNDRSRLQKRSLREKRNHWYFDNELSVSSISDIHFLKCYIKTFTEPDQRAWREPRFDEPRWRAAGAKFQGDSDDESLRSTEAEYNQRMTNEFTAIIERDQEWYVAYCPEIPGANGQGKTKEEARESLAAAIALILEDRREDALRGLPKDAERDTIRVG